MKIASFRFITVSAVIFTLSALPPLLFASTIIWNGASGTDTNWSNGNNWAGAVAPAGGDDVKFFETGTNMTLGLPNSLVDGGFTGGISSLQLGNTNGMHTIVIASGQTLSITNGNLVVGTPGDVAAIRNLTNTITGAGGTLMVSNPAAVISIQQGTATAVNGSRGNLDLSGLDTFVANVKAIGIGSTGFPNPSGANQREAGSLILAKTNFITLAWTDTLANFQLAGKTNAIELSRNPGNNSAILSQLVLGKSNVINVDSMAFGRDKASAGSQGIMVFNSAFTNNNPVAVFRGASGGSSRVIWWALGDMNANASSAQVAVGTNDFSFGTIDARINVLSIGRDCSPSHTATANIVGSFTFSSGVVDANTIYVGNQVLGPNTSLAPVRGTLTMNGANASLVVNSNLILGFTTVASTAATNTSGTFNIRNGATARINTVLIGNATTNAIITMTNGTLVISNTVGTPGKSLTVLAITNSTLQLNVTGVTNVICGVLASDGATNIINPAAVAVFSSYPKQIQVLKYTTQTGQGAANFGLGSSVLPPSAPGAYLLNNIANSSIDLVLPNDPRPVITNNFGTPVSTPTFPNPGDTAALTIGISPYSVTPVGYQWNYNGSPVTDGLTVNGSTYSGSATSTLTINNSQTNDSGNFTVVITNVYGSATSSVLALVISTNPVAPTISGLVNTTVIQGNTATLAANVNSKPAPDLQWQFNGSNLTDGPTGNGDIISNSTSSTLSIFNAQYPASQGTYSLIATNIAGAVTNSVTLTVIVPPFITLQPTNVVVTNTQAASFSANATGVPAVAYQWKKNGSPIGGATSATYTIPSAAPSDIATYSCTITNQAGTTNTASVTLTVNSLMAFTALAPANAATGICYDTPLSITFSSAPTLRSGVGVGAIKIYAVGNPIPVDTIDMSQGNPQPRTFPGDTQGFNYIPVVITGSTAVIYPHSLVMTSNQTYYVMIDNGVFADSVGAYFAGITDSNTWQFTTKPGGPVDPVNPVVNGDGSADFVTVQGAVENLAADAAGARRVINIRDGIYFGIVNVSGKTNVILRGQSQSGTVIKYPNNANLQQPQFAGSTHARMTFKVNANDVAILNLTITNSTPQGGSQAEALMIETGAKRCIVFGSTIVSRQDTILANVNSSQAYFYQCNVKGNFDYIWGGGNLYFHSCLITTISGSGGANLTAARTDTSGTTSTNFPWLNPGGSYTANGMSFVFCPFVAEPGAGAVTLAGANGTGGNNVSWYGCGFATNYIAPSASLFSGNFVFWQALNTSNGANPVTYPVLTSISGNDPRLLAATNVTTWFYGWTPTLAPIITTQPGNLSVSQGQFAGFTIVATGIPAPTYQLLKNGSPISVADSNNPAINNAVRTNAGNYSIVVSNAAGSVTSSVVTLTYTGNVAPVAATSAYSRAANLPLKIAIAGDLANNWSDADGDPEALSGGISSTNGATVSYDGSYVYYSNPNNVADQINYTISDGQGGTAAGIINVVVISVTAPNIASPVVDGNGHPTFSGHGIPGYVFGVESAPSLSGPWVNADTGQVTVGSDGSWTFTDTTQTNPGTIFYRLYYPYSATPPQ